MLGFRGDAVVSVEGVKDLRWFRSRGSFGPRVQWFTGLGFSRLGLHFGKRRPRHSVRPRASVATRGPWLSTASLSKAII